MVAFHDTYFDPFIDDDRHYVYEIDGVEIIRVSFADIDLLREVYEDRVQDGDMISGLFLWWTIGDDRWYSWEVAWEKGLIALKEKGAWDEVYAKFCEVRDRKIAEHKRACNG